MWTALKGVFNARTGMVALVVGMIATAGAYHYGGKHMKAKMLSELARENQLAQEVYEAALAATAEEISKIQIVNTTVREELEREIHHRTEYRDCRHDDNALRLLNAILSQELSAESADTDQLP